MAQGHHFKSTVAIEKYGHEDQLWDHVLLESRHFVALPTLGHLVQGWLLVVPRDCYLCAGALSSQLLSELVGFLDRVTSLVKSEYGPVAIFEHGPVQRYTAVGCGVDHAHVHVVPIESDWPLLQIAKKWAPQLTWETASSIQDTKEYFINKKQYLFLREPFSINSVIGTGSSIPSQLFRRIIARYVGRPQDFDWKIYPEHKQIYSTIGRLRKYSDYMFGLK